MISSIQNWLAQREVYNKLSVVNNYLDCEQRADQGPAQDATFLKLIQDGSFDLNAKFPFHFTPYGNRSVIYAVLHSANGGNQAALEALPSLVERGGINWCDPKHNPDGTVILSRLMDLEMRAQGESKKKCPEHRAFYSLLERRLERGFDYGTPVTTLLAKTISPFYVIMGGVAIRDSKALNLLNQLVEFPGLDWNTEVRHNLPQNLTSSSKITRHDYLTLAYIFIEAIKEQTLELLETFVKKRDINWFQFTKPIQMSNVEYKEQFPRGEYVKMQPWAALLRAAEKHPRARACLDRVLIQEKATFRSMKLRDIFDTDKVNDIFKSALERVEGLYKEVVNERVACVLHPSRPQSFPIKALFEKAIEALEIVAEMSASKQNPEPAWYMSRLFEDIQYPAKKLLWSLRFAKIASEDDRDDAWLRVAQIYNQKIRPAQHYTTHPQAAVKENNSLRKTELWEAYKAAFEIDRPDGVLLRARIIADLIFGKKAGEHLPPGENELFLGKMNCKTIQYRFAEELINTKRSAYQFKKKVEKRFLGT